MQNHSVGKPWRVYCFAHEGLEQLQGLGQVYIQECRTDLGWGIYRGVIQTWARMGTRVSFRPRLGQLCTGRRQGGEIHMVEKEERMQQPYRPEPANVLQSLAPLSLPCVVLHLVFHRHYHGT